MQLTEKYRPRKFDDVKGQPEAVRFLSRALERDCLPNVLLLAGPTGCGKTTLAEILASALVRHSASLTPITRVNASHKDEREQIARMIGTERRYKPAGNSVYVLNEVHGTTPSQQRELLDILEGLPDGLFVIMTTTATDCLDKAFRQRATLVNLSEPGEEQLRAHVEEIAGREGVKLDRKAAARVAVEAEGSFRAAVDCLQRELLTWDHEAA